MSELECASNSEYKPTQQEAVEVAKEAVREKPADAFVEDFIDALRDDPQEESDRCWHATSKISEDFREAVRASYVSDGYVEGTLWHHFGGPGFRTLEFVELVINLKGSFAPEAVWSGRLLEEYYWDEYNPVIPGLDVIDVGADDPSDAKFGQRVSLVPTIWDK
jgi:hypothetical protein